MKRIFRVILSLFVAVWLAGCSLWGLGLDDGMHEHHIELYLVNKTNIPLRVVSIRTYDISPNSKVEFNPNTPSYLTEEAEFTAAETPWHFVVEEFHYIPRTISIYNKDTQELIYRYTESDDTPESIYEVENWWYRHELGQYGTTTLHFHEYYYTFKEPIVPEHPAAEE